MIREVKNPLGKNRTGIASAPVDASLTQEGATRLNPIDPASLQTVGENRVRFMREAEPLESAPVSFIDKLGERLAFERTGSRIYEALISQWNGTEDRSMLPPLEMLQRFRDEEHDHFQMLFRTIEELGFDPTAITPAANSSSVATLGLIQVVSDPRTSFSQALDAVLIAELADHDSWDLLAQLAELAGASEAAARFRLALEQEAFHLQKVREWVQQMAIGLPIDLSLQENQQLAAQDRPRPIEA